MAKQRILNFCDNPTPTCKDMKEDPKNKYHCKHYVPGLGLCDCPNPTLLFGYNVSEKDIEEYHINNKS